MKSELTCFKAYDIRGKLGSELNENIAYRIGRAYGEFVKPKAMVVGSDVRLSSESLKISLANGLQDAGCKVFDIGLTGTEEIYFATSHLGVDGGIEITASHNPLDYNGMKLVSKGSKPISGDTGLNEIKNLAEIGDFQPVDKSSRGSYVKIDVLEAYTDKIFSYIDPSNFNRQLKIVVNSGNGAAGHAIDALEKRFNESSIPIQLIKINHEPNGNFPRGIPNPLLPECRQDTIDAVIENKADMGVAFDGDFDRCFLFDADGNFIEGYYIVGLLAEAFLEKNHGESIIHDPRLTWNTIDIVKKTGGVPVLSKTGHAFIKERMRSENAIYGGEMSAHHYFRDFYYCDSGMIPWLLIAELLCIKDSSLKQLVEKRIVMFPSSGEINFTLKSPRNSIDTVLKHYEKQAVSIDCTDGVSLEFEDWRFNLRSSNTEPLVRLNVESRGDADLMASKTQEISSLLTNGD